MIINAGNAQNDLIGRFLEKFYFPLKRVLSEEAVDFEASLSVDLDYFVLEDNDFVVDGELDPLFEQDRFPANKENFALREESVDLLLFEEMARVVVVLGELEAWRVFDQLAVYGVEEEEITIEV